MPHQETMLSSKPVFTGKILAIKQDTVLLENGSEVLRDVVLHNGGVCVAAFDEEDNLLMVRQFRYPFCKELLEIPAGKLEAGEDPASCGIRELEEEAGCVAESFEKLGVLLATPAYCTEIIHLYEAHGLTQTCQNLDPDEFLTVLRIPFERAVEMVLGGEIEDAKTQLAILKIAVLRQKAVQQKSK